MEQTMVMKWGLATLLLGAVAAQAGEFTLEVKMDREPAIYKPGETAKLRARLLEDGKPVGGRTALCSWNYLNSNRVEIAEGGTTFELTLDRPGQVLFRGDVFDGTNVVRGTYGKWKNVPLIIWGGAVFSPEKLRPTREKPADFDAYWENAVAEMKRLVPLEPAAVRLTPTSAADGFEAWAVEIPCLPRPSCGYLTKPKGVRAKSLPAVVMFQGYGNFRSVKEYVTNGLFLCVNAHGYGNDHTDAEWGRFYKEHGRHYEYGGWRDRDTCFFRGQILRAVRALEWLKTLPEWDGRNLAVKGVSMGGSQSIQAAALDKDVTLCVPRDPAMCDHAGLLDDPPHRSGWPWILYSPRNLPAVVDYGPVDPVLLKTSDYYDNVFFASRITCPVYFATGFADDVCFSEGVYKAFNATRGPKHMATNPYNGHCGTFNAEGEARLLMQGAPERPVLMLNEDNDHYFKQDSSLMTEAALNAYVDRLTAGGHVTHIFFCVCGQRPSYASKVWEPIWTNDGHDRFFGDATNDIWAVNAKKLFDAGIDPYAVWTARCRTRGVSPWISMRMNDHHWLDVTNFFRTTYFHRAHPEYRRLPVPRADPEKRRWEDYAFDFTHKEVRDFHLAMVAELFERYDADGLELDWMRCGHHLPPGKAKASAGALTEFVRAAHELAEKASRRRGRKIKLSVRVPVDPDLAARHGMDAVVWAKEGLVDLIVPHSSFSTDFNLPYPEWRRRVPENILVVPGCDSTYKFDAGWTNVPKMTPELYRGWSLDRYREGAPGVYLFNLEYLDTQGPDHTVPDVIYREGLAPATCARKPHKSLKTFRDYPGYDEE